MSGHRSWQRWSRAQGVFRVADRIQPGPDHRHGRDSVLALFETAAGAVASALAVQKELHAALKR